jgi:prevent-host-death family protein
MESSLLTLRRSPAKILNAIETGQEVTLTRRGKPIARIVPAHSGSTKTTRSQAAFGMWQDFDVSPVADQIRAIRKGRSFDL